MTQESYDSQVQSSIQRTPPARRSQNDQILQEINHLNARIHQIVKHLFAKQNDRIDIQEAEQNLIDKIKDIMSQMGQKLQNASCRKPPPQSQPPCRNRNVEEAIESVGRLIVENFQEGRRLIQITFLQQQNSDQNAKVFEINGIKVTPSLNSLQNFSNETVTKMTQAQFNSLLNKLIQLRLRNNGVVLHLDNSVQQLERQNLSNEAESKDREPLNCPLKREPQILINESVQIPQSLLNQSQQIQDDHRHFNFAFSTVSKHLKQLSNFKEFKAQFIKAEENSQGDNINSFNKKLDLVCDRLISILKYQNDHSGDIVERTVRQTLISLQNLMQFFLKESSYLISITNLLGVCFQAAHTNMKLNEQIKKVHQNFKKKRLNFSKTFSMVGRKSFLGVSELKDLVSNLVQDMKLNDQQLLNIKQNIKSLQNELKIADISLHRKDQ